MWYKKRSFTQDMQWGHSKVEPVSVIIETEGDICSWKIMNEGENGMN
jgi:hypothetical protein